MSRTLPSDLPNSRRLEAARRRSQQAGTVSNDSFTREALRAYPGTGDC